jgi:hypothetical protein
VRLGNAGFPLGLAYTTETLNWWQYVTDMFSGPLTSPEGVAVAHLSAVLEDVSGLVKAKLEPASSQSDVPFCIKGDVKLTPCEIPVKEGLVGVPPPLTEYPTEARYWWLYVTCWGT